jgi:nucleoside phosphorylase
MRSGELVADLPSEDAELACSARRAAAAAAAAIHFGRLADADHVLGAAEKGELALRSGACAVDMESRALRLACADGGSRFLAVRAVFDEAADELPLQAPAGEDALALARYALSRPRRWPSMLRAALRARRAGRALASFLREFLPSL